ncbi:cell wall hydrolase [Altererythrobacter soli]|uniref:Cell wall hydrolase n=1 Tax=Croceibacterium soli TaxID=1739690 RepID=A0A6I4UT02_9SPHN|nr:cell wall hydrolase [Croceibacterium soli]MXP41606.1 cell wall hydrolase [Croceibacterium soli]
MTALHINPPVSFADRMRPRGVALPKVAAAVAALAVASAAAGFFLLRQPAVAAPNVQLSSTMRAEIGAMSTGAEQAVLVSGETAQLRNARIPFAAESLGGMRGFADIDSASPQYGTALKCLTQAIYYEAANETELGKRAVAQVVLNRLRHPEYPNSVCGVVYEGASAPVCQFSFTCDGSLLRRPMARQWAESRRVAAAALAGSVVPEVGSATHYHADYVLPRWAYSLGKLRQIGTHIFYRFPGRVGMPEVFADRWSGSEAIPSLDFGRLRSKLAVADEPVIEEAEPAYVPGLAVVPDVKDRHAPADVGGRIDPAAGWRLSIPDPVQLSANYRSALSQQGAAKADAGAAEPAAPAPTQGHAAP